MYKAYCDGYTYRMSGYASIAYIIKSEDSAVVDKHVKKIGKASIHEAEYVAVIETLSKLQKLGIKEVVVISDDSLVVNQINGDWEITDEKLKHLHSEVMEIRDFFDIIQFLWLPESENEAASMSKELLTPKKGVFTGDISRLDENRYQVVGKNTYIVDLFLSNCTCPAYQNMSTRPCKHIIAVEGQVEIE
ncbi:ribonuclease HI family protein [Brevibacillus reuszeri]|uniref:ribonuclease HI family protein n=1 Tax=Brevibacillus reuszeri TaxID=54915 RepID=UPI000CCC1786|nr:reverse transcriptase-like protein [Brevibacillus reuszeri]